MLLFVVHSHNAVLNDTIKGALYTEDIPATWNKLAYAGLKASSQFFFLSFCSNKNLRKGSAVGTAKIKARMARQHKEHIR